MPTSQPVELSLAPGVGAATTSFSDLDAYLGSIASAGFPSVSLGLQQVEVAFEEAGGLDRVAALVARHGLRCPDVLSVAARRDAEATLATTAQLAQLASAVGADHVLVLLFTGLRDESIRLLSTMADLVGGSGARLAFEFTPGNAVSNIRDALALVEQIGPDRMGVMIDTWHFFRGGSTWEQLETIPLERIAYLQFNDALPPLSDDVLDETMNRRTWPAHGEFDLHRFARTLTGRGWTGLVSVEVLSEEHRRLDVETFTRLAYGTTAPYWVPDR